MTSAAKTSKANTKGTLFDAIRNQFNKDTRKPQEAVAPPLVNAVRNDLETPTRTLGDNQASNQIAPQTRQSSIINSVQLPQSSPRSVSSIPALKSSTASIEPPSSLTSLMSAGVPTVSYGNDKSMDVSVPNLEKEEEKPDEDQSSYESYFLENGISQDDLDEINNRGSWLDVHLNNPATAAVTDNFGKNPFLDVDAESFADDFANELNTIMTTGNLVHHDVPDKYESDNSSTIGDIHAVDDGQTMDYDHLTADKVTGEAMQRYGELGMGGRGWWEYSPSSIYTKSDEANDFGFRPYLPDETARANLRTSEYLDAPKDVTTGILGNSRNLVANLLGQGYRIKYDQDGNRDTTEDVLDIDGTDWDYRARPYVDNMTRLLSYQPDTFMTMPENGEIHGAPVSTLVQEYQIEDADGSTKYLHGRVDDEKSGWVADGNGDYLYQLVFTDGQSVNLPNIEENQNIEIPDPTYVPIEQARGVLPENLDQLNDVIRQDGYENIYEAPVLYLPDLVMDDGTRITWDQAQNIYSDKELEDNPDSDLDDNISYDVNPLNKPRRLMGEVSNDFLANLPSNMWDLTAGSLPIAIDKFAWPISIASAASDSLAGVDPGSYDPLTGSSQYLSAKYDENGHIVPTYNDTQRAMNFAGNALVPLTEQIAGPVSGHSAIEWLSGKSKPGSSVKQILRDFALGMLGEGLEEVIGNFFDELTNQGLAAYGNNVDEEGKSLLDENGDYKDTDIYGNPMTYMTDETGHTYKDINTPIGDRVRNMLNPEDALNAMLGGAIVDATMQLVPMPGINSRDTRLFPQLRDAARRDKIREQLGLTPYREVERGDEEIDPNLFSEIFEEGAE